MQRRNLEILALPLLAIIVLGGCSPAEPPGPKRRVEPSGGFSFVPPAKWSANKIAGNDFAVYFGPRDPKPALEFRRDLSVPDEADSVEFLRQRAEKVYEDSGLLESADFTTDSGLRGKRIVLENRSQKDGKPAAIRQIIYLFPNGGDTHTFWGSAPSDDGTKYDADFDAVAKSYRIEKIE